MRETRTDDRLTTLAALDLARRMPSVFTGTCAHHWPGLHVAARTIRMTDFGGDFHVACRVPDGLYCLAVGTVSGAGILAALGRSALATAVSTLSAAVRSAATLVAQLDDVLRDINAHLRDEPVTCSLFCAVVDGVKQRLEYVNTGKYSTVVSVAGGRSHKLESTTSNLAGLGVGPIEAKTIGFTAGRRLWVFSEGVPFAESPARRGSGVAWLRGGLLEAVGRRLDEQLDALMDAAHRYACAAGGPSQDITMLAAQMPDAGRRPAESAVDEWVRTCSRVTCGSADSSVFLG